MIFNVVSFLWNCHCRLFNMANHHLRQTCFIVSNMKWILIRIQAVSLRNQIKLMKVNRGKKFRRVSAFCWLVFREVCLSSFHCVLCICVYEFVWMCTHGCVYSCVHVNGDQRYCVAFFIVVPLSFWNRLCCWIWTSPSRLAAKLQESLHFCLLCTRIIGTCIAPGYHVGAENLNSDHCDYIEGTLCVVFLDFCFSMLLPSGDSPEKQNQKDVWNVTSIYYIKLNISVRITTWEISIF